MQNVRISFESQLNEEIVNHKEYLWRKAYNQLTKENTFQ